MRCHMRKVLLGGSDALQTEETWDESRRRGDPKRERARTFLIWAGRLQLELVDAAGGVDVEDGEHLPYAEDGEHLPYEEGCAAGERVGGWMGERLSEGGRSGCMAPHLRVVLVRLRHEERAHDGRDLVVAHAQRAQPRL